MDDRQVGNRGKRTDKERKEDALKGLKLQILGYRLVDITKAINEDRPYNVSIETVSKDIRTIDLPFYKALISSDDDRISASVWYSALADYAIVEGVANKDTQMLRIAIDARWKMHQISTEENERFAALMADSDPDKITPEWASRLRKLVKEVEKGPTGSKRGRSTAKGRNKRAK